MYMRYLVMSYTLKELENNWLFGIGLKSVGEKISDKILSDGYNRFYPKNTHNQFLHYWIGLGIFGLLFFLYLTIHILRYSNSGVYIIFFLLLTMLTESILVRSKGILLFTFFSLLFLNKELLNDKNYSHS